ncbi:hypothetical protein [Mesorhizobium sp. M1329]
MKRFVAWSREALDDVKQQVAFVAGENPAAARHVARLAAGGMAGLAD